MRYEDPSSRARKLGIKVAASSKWTTFEKSVTFELSKNGSKTQNFRAPCAGG